MEGIVSARLQQLKQGATPRPLVIKGEWGVGKSHSLAYAGARSIQADCAFSTVTLNARSAPPSAPQRFYPGIVGRLRAAGAIGLRDLVVNVAAQSKHLPPKSQLGLNDEFRSSLQRVFSFLNVDNVYGLEDGAGWTTLLGGDICWADYPYKREKALERLASLAETLHHLGFGGLVLALDELETVVQLWNVRSRTCAYSVFGRLLRTPHIWLLMASTERFDSIVSHDAFAARAPSDDAVHFMNAWTSSRLDIWQPAEPGLKEARALAGRVAYIYSQAHAVPTNAGAVEAVVQAWNANPSRNLRRLLRQIVEHLDVARPLDLMAQ